MGSPYRGRSRGAPNPSTSWRSASGCSPENIGKLEKAVFDEIKVLQKDGIGADYLAKIKELWRRAHETNLRDNGFWLRELERAYTYGDDPKLILDFDSMVEKISSDRVRPASKRYLPGDAVHAGRAPPRGDGHSGSPVTDRGTHNPKIEHLGSRMP